MSGLADSPLRALSLGTWKGGGWARQAPVGIGLLALLLAAVLAWGLTPRWRADQARIEQAGRSLARTGPTPPPATAVVVDGLQHLGALPPADEGPRRVAELLALAARLGVTVDGARQGMAQGLSPVGATAPSTGIAASNADLAALQRVPLNLVAHGRYSALRRFVAEALQQDDALALVQLRLNRPQADGRELSADLQWSLLQRVAVPGAKARPTTTDTTVDTSVATGTAGAVLR
jgi:hypothetical protein